METPNDHSQKSVEITEKHLQNMARLTTAFCMVYRDHYGRMETPEDQIFLGMLAEETILMLPDDAEVKHLNKASTEEILAYIRDKQKQHNKYTRYANSYKPIPERKVQITYTILAVAAACGLAILFWLAFTEWGEGLLW